jgi:hypothetical protein
MGRRMPLVKLMPQLVTVVTSACVVYGDRSKQPAARRPRARRRQGPGAPGPEAPSHPSPSRSRPGGSRPRAGWARRTAAAHDLALPRRQVLPMVRRCLPARDQDVRIPIGSTPPDRPGSGALEKVAWQLALFTSASPQPQRGCGDADSRPDLFQDAPGNSGAERAAQRRAPRRSPPQRIVGTQLLEQSLEPNHGLPISTHHRRFHRGRGNGQALDQGADEPVGQARL